MISCLVNGRGLAENYTLDRGVFQFLCSSLLWQLFGRLASTSDTVALHVERFLLFFVKCQN